VIKAGTVQPGNRKFLCSRNPWGRFEWKGDYCDSSELWKNDKDARDCLLSGQDMVPKDDGVFWMSRKDLWQ